MADLSKTIQIIFEGVDNLSGGLGEINTGIGALAGGVEKATQPLANLTAGILAAEAAALALGAAVISSAVKASVEFESALVDLNKVLGEGDGQISDYIPNINAMSDTFATSATAVAGLAGDLKQAGFTAEEVFGTNGGFGLAQLALEAVKISTLSADEASAVFVRTLSGFQEPASEAGRLLDILNEASNTSGASFADLAESFGRVGPVATGAGLSFEDTAGYLVVLNEKFQSGEISATAFNSIMLQLGSDSPRVAAALDALGISQTGLNGALRPTADIIDDLAKKWPELTKEQQNQAAQNLVGLEQSPKLLAILNDYPGVLEAQKIAYASTGSAQKEFNVAVEQSAFVADQAAVKWENLQIAIGDKFKPAVSSSTEAMGNFAAAIRTAVEGGELEPFFAAILPLFDGFSERIDGIAKALPEAFAGVDWGEFEDAIQRISSAFGGVFGEFEDAIQRISSAFGGVFGDLDLTKPEDLTKAIQGLIDIGTLFINTTSGIAEGLKPLFQIIGLVVDAFTSLSPELQAAAGYLLGLSTTANIVSGVVVGLSGAIGGIGKTIGLVESFLALKLATIDLGPALLGLSAAFAGFKVGEYLADLTDLDERFGEWLLTLKGIPPVIGASDDAISRSGATLQSLATDLGKTSLTMEEFNALADSGKIVWDATANKWVLAGTAAKDLGASFDTIGLGDLISEFNALSPALQLATDGTVEASDAAREFPSAAQGMALYLDDATGKWVSYSGEVLAGAEAVKAGGEELKAAAEKAELMTRASAEFILGWEKIQSAERIAIFELSADIQIAQIEADAKRTIAAFDAMSSSFANTGDVLTELFGIWAGLDSSFDQSKVEQWIEREYKIREDLAKAQIALVEAEIKRIEAQSALLDRGGMDVKISSDGLEPALEAFMFSVIDKVRVQVAGSYQEFLMGCGT